LLLLSRWPSWSRLLLRVRTDPHVDDIADDTELVESLPLIR
jgi:hypothetical protein